MFIAQLTRKAEDDGVVVEYINRGKTKLPQNGKVAKKRHHGCSCGVESQRDLFPAHLAGSCNFHTLDLSRAKAPWPAAEPLLRRAMSRLTEKASRGPIPTSFGISRRQSRSSVKDGSAGIGAVDVVVARNGYESHGEMHGLVVRTPWL